MRRLAGLLPLILLLSACQSTGVYQRYYNNQFGWAGCNDHAYDAGLCEQPSNFNLFGTIITGELQSG